MRRICFVCLGNICRSPLAEGVFKHQAEQAGHARDFQAESAGVGSWYIGQPADSRSQRVAQAHGIRLEGTAQQFRAGDFDRFDLVIALDAGVADDLRRMAHQDQRPKIHLLREFDPLASGDLDVPDPYYGSLPDFESVYQIVERSCQTLLESLT